MSRESPTLDDLYGPGAEAADAFAGHLDDLAERFLDLGGDSSAREQVYEAELQKMWQENRLLEGQLVSAGEEIERLRATDEPAALRDALEAIASPGHDGDYGWWTQVARRALGYATKNETAEPPPANLESLRQCTQAWMAVYNLLLARIPDFRQTDQDTGGERVLFHINRLIDGAAQPPSATYGVREVLSYLTERATWLDREMRNGGNLEHLRTRYEECRYIAKCIEDTHKRLAVTKTDSNEVTK